jgi:arginase
MASIGVLGVPANSAGTTNGVAQAPAALRDAGLVAALQRVSSTVDYGDVQLPAPIRVRDPETHVIDPAGLEAVVEGTRAGVASILEDERFPLVVGGDCPILLGCLAAFADIGPRGLLFVDGHEDAYPPERSTTGEAADMELGFALGLVETPWWPGSVAHPPLVALQHIQVLGPRDRAALEAEGGLSLSERASLVDGKRLAADPAGSARAAVASLRTPWWFHLDLDVLSTDALPAIDYPQEGGITWDDLDVIGAAALAASPVGWDVTIYNPDLDPDRIHARRIVRFIHAAVRALPAAG